MDNDHPGSSVVLNRTVVELIDVSANCALVIFRVKAQVAKTRLSKGQSL